MGRSNIVARSTGQLPYLTDFVFCIRWQERDSLEGKLSAAAVSHYFILALAVSVRQEVNNFNAVIHKGRSDQGRTVTVFGFPFAANQANPIAALPGLLQARNPRLEKISASVLVIVNVAVFRIAVRVVGAPAKLMSHKSVLYTGIS